MFLRSNYKLTLPYTNYPTIALCGQPYFRFLFASHRPNINLVPLDSSISTAWAIRAAMFPNEL
jgi:hypothetical protein